MLNPVFKVFGAVRDTLVSRMGACIFLMAMGGAGAVSGQQSAVYQSFVADPVRSILPDFSYAGYAYGEKPIPEPSVVLNVVEYGVLPDTGEDLTEVVQRLIDQAGERGGGVIYFPPGEYCLTPATRNIICRSTTITLYCGVPERLQCSGWFDL